MYIYGCMYVYACRERHRQRYVNALCMSLFMFVFCIHIDLFIRGLLQLLNCIRAGNSSMLCYVIVKYSLLSSMENLIVVLWLMHRWYLLPDSL